MPEQRISIEAVRASYSAEIEAGRGSRGLGDHLLHTLTQPKILALATAGAAASVAFGPGIVEGIARGYPFPDFLTYGLIDSLFTATRADIKLREISEDVRTFIPLLTTEVQAVLGSTVLTALAVNWLRDFRERSARRQIAIIEGRATIERPHEQMFLFGGEDSQAVNTLSAILGDQALPLFENAKASETILNRIARGRSLFPTDRSGNPQVPVYLDLGVDGAIGYQNSLGWSRLGLKQGNLLQTTDGKSLLVTYGFGETNKEVLPLTDETEQDLTVSELLAGTNQLESLAKKRGIRIDQIVRVYLGNARLRRQRHTGFGVTELTNRKAATGIDIFVDTRSALVGAVVNLIGEAKWVAFETSRLDYVQGLREAAKSHGISLYDEAHPVGFRGFRAALVHEDDVSDTLELAAALVGSRIYSKVIALTPTLWAHERAGERGIESLCVPLVYADLMLEIRRKLRAGEEPTSIQNDFDQRYPYS